MASLDGIQEQEPQWYILFKTDIAIRTKIEETQSTKVFFNKKEIYTQFHFF